MSRKMKPEEEDAFEKKHGFKPTRISLALDCLPIYVHKDNPIKGLTLPQAAENVAKEAQPPLGQQRNRPNERTQDGLVVVQIQQHRTLYRGEKIQYIYVNH